jgi:hypothetical protein
MLKWMGTDDIPLERPVSLSVSSAISFLTSAATIQMSSCAEWHRDKLNQNEQKIAPDREFCQQWQGSHTQLHTTHANV